MLLDTSPGESRMIALAREPSLTVYDAPNLELALRRGLALATLDQPLMAAARAEGVPLVGESGRARFRRLPNPPPRLT